MKAFLLSVFILTLFLSSSPGFVAAQHRSPCDKLNIGLPENYNEQTARIDLQRARELTAPDSLRQKALLLYYVQLFDSTSQIGQFAKTTLAHLWEAKMAEIDVNLQGSWRWLSTIVWSDLDTPQSTHCEKQVVFSADSITYFHDGAIEKQEAYRLYFRPRFIGKQDFLIETEEQCWLVRFSSDAFWLSSPSPGATLFLEVNDHFGYGCGGTDFYYEKIVRD